MNHYFDEVDSGKKVEEYREVSKNYGKIELRRLNTSFRPAKWCWKHGDLSKMCEEILSNATRFLSGSYFPKEYIPRKLTKRFYIARLALWEVGREESDLWQKIFSGPIEVIHKWSTRCSNSIIRIRTEFLLKQKKWMLESENNFTNSLSWILRIFVFFDDFSLHRLKVKNWAVFHEKSWQHESSLSPSSFDAVVGRALWFWLFSPDP